MAKIKLEARRMEIPSILSKAVSCTGISLYRALPWLNPELLRDVWKQVRLECNRECGTRSRGMRPEEVDIVHQRLGIADCLEKHEFVRYDLMAQKFVRVSPSVMKVRDLCGLEGTFIVGAKYPWHATCVHNGRVYDSFWTEAQAMDKTITEYYEVIESRVEDAKARHDFIYMSRIRNAEARKAELKAERSARMKARYQAMREAREAASDPSNGEMDEATAVALLLA